MNKDGEKTKGQVTAENNHPKAAARAAGFSDNFN
jgi:hypothetical protein